MTLPIVFSVFLSDLRAEDLACLTETGYNNPYLKVYFPGKPPIKTEVQKRTLNPRWRFKSEFYYSEILFPDLLPQKYMAIECWHNRMFNDKFIGRASIDLFTLATGPSHYTLNLKKEDNSDAGRVFFKIQMDEVRNMIIRLESLVLVPNDESSADTLYLEYRYSAKRSIDPTYKSSVMSVEKLTTIEASPMIVNASLKSFQEESIEIKVKKKSVSKLKTTIQNSQCRVQFSTYFSPEENVGMPFKEPLMLSGKIVADLIGVVKYANLPKFAQMKGGTFDENGIQGGLVVVGATPPTPVRPHPETLHTYARSYSLRGRIATLTTPVRSGTPVYRDPTSNLPPLPPPLPFPPLEPQTPSSVLPLKLNSLPTGWEVRRNSKDQLYYLDHNTCSTHWNLPIENDEI
eukprot:TRINITY_DN1106_c0_g1_i2.p1 TRINITY_DN1106_c0_g1~~TRINITY_DN1106_c0_g1_i2.p1  ORF type:complete len:402 (+),score=72.76 TRINITY_DN1106_c0_g1_i2:62-1267(+)